LRIVSAIVSLVTGALAGTAESLISGNTSPAPWPRCCSPTQGAHVIHVDPLAGPRWQHPADAVYNRGKQRITLTLKQAIPCGIA
jgi:hypothetical protein